MNDSLVLTLLSFLKEQQAADSALLLGLSGGIDSLALLYLLLECRQSLPFRLGIAHLDHGWRPESKSEAHSLQALAEKFNLPFHLKTLEAPVLRSNLEEKGRMARMEFFRDLCEHYGYRAVLLGHQMDDQAETVIKKIFEGTHLTACYGIAQVSQVEKITFWRPLLSITKKQLANWLQERGHVPFEDSTNYDPQFLRGRMRTAIIPELERLFGKRMVRSIAHFSREAEELAAFMHAHLGALLQQIHTLPGGGVALKIPRASALSVFESKYLLRHLCRLAGALPSKDIVEKASRALIAGHSNKRFVMGKQTLFLYKGTVCVTKADGQFRPFFRPLQEKDCKE